jgi:hypothetical protein
MNLKLTCCCGATTDSTVNASSDMIWLLEHWKELHGKCPELYAKKIKPCDCEECKKYNELPPIKDTAEIVLGEGQPCMLNPNVKAPEGRIAREG